MTQLIALRATDRSADIRVPARGKLAAPTGFAVAAVATGGTFAAATYFWKIVATNASGVSLPSTEVTVAIVLNGSATLTWNAVTGATGYRIYRGTATGAEGAYQTDTASPFTDTGAAGTTLALPTVATGSATSGLTELSTTVDTIVDIDDAATRLALTRHSAVRQYYVSAVNTNAHWGTSGALTALPTDA